MTVVDIGWWCFVCKFASHCWNMPPRVERPVYCAKPLRCRCHKTHYPISSGSCRLQQCLQQKCAPSMRLTKDLKGWLGCFMTGERMSKVNAWCHQKHFEAMSYAPRIEWRYNCRRNRTLGKRRICNFYKTVFPTVFYYQAFTWRGWAYTQPVWNQNEITGSYGFPIASRRRFGVK